jgi:large subunit ribosomal protein L29
MAKKTAVDYRAKTEDELETQLVELRKEQFNLRFQVANGQLENTARFRQVRRDIARTKLIISEKKSGTRLNSGQQVTKRS